MVLRQVAVLAVAVAVASQWASLMLFLANHFQQLQLEAWPEPRHLVRCCRPLAAHLVAPVLVGLAVLARLVHRFEWHSPQVVASVVRALMVKVVPAGARLGLLTVLAGLAAQQPGLVVVLPGLAELPLNSQQVAAGLVTLAARPVVAAAAGQRELDQLYPAVLVFTLPVVSVAQPYQLPEHLLHCKRKIYSIAL